MPLFSISSNRLSPMEHTNFSNEKALQTLLENNLLTVFNCRLVASEFSTGSQHAGRIDTLALSEDNNPVIIEYKKVESSELITQGLYYLAWVDDHRGDFELAAQRKLGSTVMVDWGEVRVICIAPNYKKYDLYAAQKMGANLELWTYRLFKNEFLYLEETLRKSLSSTTAMPTPANGKNPVMVAAGKKAAITRATGSYTFQEHLEGKPDSVRELALAVQDFVLSIDEAIEETPKKNYVAYKISQNIVCMEVQTHRLLLHLKLNPKEIPNLPSIARDMTDKGHFGTGDLELSVKSLEDLQTAKHYILLAYQKVGG